VTGAKTDTCSPCRKTSKTGCPIIRGKMDIAQISLRVRVWRNLNTWVQLNAYSQYRVLCCNHFLSLNWNRHFRIWGNNIPHAVVETARYTSKFNDFCAVLEQKMFGPLIFVDRTPNCVMYLHILEELIIPVLEEAGLYVLLKQAGGPPVSHIAAGDLLDRYRLEAALVT